MCHTVLSDGPHNIDLIFKRVLNTEHWFLSPNMPDAEFLSWTAQIETLLISGFLSFIAKRCTPKAKKKQNNLTYCD